MNTTYYTIKTGSADRVYRMVARNSQPAQRELMQNDQKAGIYTLLDGTYTLSDGTYTLVDHLGVCELTVRDGGCRYAQKYLKP